MTTQRLAAELGVSGPSVTNMVKRLDEQGLLRHSRYHGVELTPAGERIALAVIRHQRLLELYLTRELGFGWDEVYAEAERLEHHVSDALVSRIAARLGQPTHDPHGDPIPSANGELPEINERRLVDLDPGERAVVARVPDRDSGQLRYLGGLGLYPGAPVTLLEKHPFEGPLRIGVGEQEHVIGRPLAAVIRVDRPTAA